MEKSLCISTFQLKKGEAIIILSIVIKLNSFNRSLYEIWVLFTMQY
jgi:hypothetical protein